MGQVNEDRSVAFLCDLQENYEPREWRNAYDEAPADIRLHSFKKYCLAASSGWVVEGTSNPTWPVVTITNGDTVVEFEAILYLSGKTVTGHIAKRIPALYLGISIIYGFARIGVPMDSFLLLLDLGDPVYHPISAWDATRPLGELLELLRPGAFPTTWDPPDSRRPLEGAPGQVVKDDAAACCQTCKALRQLYPHRNAQRALKLEAVYDDATMTVDLDVHFAMRGKVDSCRVEDYEWLENICHFASSILAEYETDVTELDELVEAYSRYIDLEREA